MVVKHIREVERVFGNTYAPEIILRLRFSEADAICSA